jgi:hypothetical protein
MKRMLAIVCLLAGACGGSDGGSKSTTPTTPTIVNREPVVNSVTVNPGSGIQDRTLFNFAVSASDADNDSLSFAWTIAGGTFSGQNVALTFRGGGTEIASVTVSDGKGGTASGSQTFVVGTLTGNWSGAGPAGIGNFTMTLNQVSGQITGSYRDGLGAATVGPTGEPGAIDVNGNISLRTKQAPYTDWTFRGTLDPTGRRVTGGVFGSGFTGQNFTMNKQ